MEYNKLDILLWEKFNFLRGSTGYTPEECLEELLNLIYIHKIKDSNREVPLDLNESFDTNGILLDESIEHEVVKSFNNNLFSSNSAGKDFGNFLSRILKGHLGSFFSPPELGDFIAKIIQPRFGEKAIDPFCGSGNFLNSLFRFEECRIYGNEIHNLTWKIAIVNLFLNGVDINFLSRKDAENKLSTENWYEYFDIVVAHPPFGMKRRSHGYEDSKYDLKKAYGSDLLPIYMEKCLRLLKKGGRMALVLPESVLRGEKYKQLRTYFETKAQIVFIVKVPSKVFMSYGSMVSSCIVFFKKFDYNKATIDWEYELEEEIHIKLRKKYKYKVANGQFLLEQNNRRLNDEISNMDELVKEFNRFKKDNNIW